MSRVDLKKCLRLLVKPGFHALVFMIVWNGIRYSLGSRVVIDGEWAAAILGGTYGLHALFAGFAIYRISSKQDVIEMADALGDKDTFLFHRDRKALDAPWRVLLIIQTLVLLGMFLLAPFPAFGWGMWLIAGGTFSLFVFWAVAEELDNPFSGIWNLHAELYHPEWRATNCRLYFEQKNQPAPPAPASL